MIAFLTFEYVLRIHDRVINQYGGRKGILHEGLLRSALEMPKARFDGKYLHWTIFDKAAAYLFHLIQNHPFIDGNKRTSSLSALIFLNSNLKGSLSIVDATYQDLILNVAQGIVTKKEIARFFREYYKGKNE